MKVLFKKEDIIGISQDLQPSNTATKNLSHNIRVVTGNRKSIESHTGNEINEINHQLDDFFEIRLLTYHIEDKKTKLSKNFKQPAVDCKDLDALIKEIFLNRGWEEADSLLIKITIHESGEFLKICRSFFDISDPLPEANSAMSKKFLEAGVHKVFIIGLVFDVGETYVNVKRLRDFAEFRRENLEEKMYSRYRSETV